MMLFWGVIRLQITNKKFPKSLFPLTWNKCCFTLISVGQLAWKIKNWVLYMVRNHQDGYPYINLSQFFVAVENIQKHNFFGKIDWSMNSWPRWAGDCQGYKKNYFNFQNLTKNGNKVWTISKAEMTLLFSSVLHFLFLLKIYRIVNFLEKLFGQWIPNRNGRGIARDIKKKYFHFQNLTINGNKLWTRETIPSQTSDMGKKTVSVLTPSLLLP